MHARLGAFAVTGALLCACPSGQNWEPSGGRASEAHALLEASAAMPRRAPQRRSADALVRNAECENCHSEIADEWRASLHAQAFTAREFQHAFKHEPLQFCRDCHAPEAGAGADPEAEALGVACVTCHLPETGGEGEALLAAPRSGTAVRGAAPHPVRRAPGFAGAGACAGCHQFEFPGDRRDAELMQTTIDEHRRSSQASRPCAECHMPVVAGRRSHAFVASREPARMREAVTIEATRPRAAEVVITLELDTDAVGHALPTGDLFRRIAVEAISTRRLLRPPKVSRYLARHWRPRALLGEHGAGSVNYTEVADDRLGVGDNPRIVRLTLDPADADLPVRWRVRYERVESFVGVEEAGAIVVGGAVLGEGVLAPMGVAVEDPGRAGVGHRHPALPHDPPDVPPHPQE